MHAFSERERERDAQTQVSVYFFSFLYSKFIALCDGVCVCARVPQFNQQQKKFTPKICTLFSYNFVYLNKHVLFQFSFAVGKFSDVKLFPIATTFGIQIMISILVSNTCFLCHFVPFARSCHMSFALNLV